MDRRELRGWSIRTLALAWPSAALALAIGAGSAAQLLAMAVGMAAYALGFARLASIPWVRATAERRRAWSALECAVWVKAAWVLAGMLAWGLVAVGLRSSWFQLPFAAAFLLDQLTGAASMGLASYLHDTIGLTRAPLHESVFQTLIATLLQGAFIALGLIPLTMAVRRYVVWRERSA